MRINVLITEQRRIIWDIALTYTWHDVLEASFREIPKKGKTTLTNFGHRILHALIEQVHDIAVDNEVFHVAIEAFCQATEEIQSDDHEVFIRSFELFRTLGVRHVLVQRLFHQRNASPEEIN